MADEIELTLGDGSSLWLLKGQIISFSGEAVEPGLLFRALMKQHAKSTSVNPLQRSGDIMGARDQAKAPGDFIE